MFNSTTNGCDILFQGIIDITTEFNVTVDIINTIYGWLFGFNRDTSNVGNLPSDVILINPNMDKTVDEQICNRLIRY